MPKALRPADHFGVASAIPFQHSVREDSFCRKAHVPFVRRRFVSRAGIHAYQKRPPKGPLWAPAGLLLPYDKVQTDPGHFY
jgi:hypothetical protein